jgi:hypothetical protein
MKVLVSDTSVLVDLERGALIESCFRLPFEFAVPDLLYRRELSDHGGPELMKIGLRVEELSPAELGLAQNVRGEHPKLSLPDAYAYVLASSRAWALLTGDGELRTLAQTKKVQCFGVLWLCDQIFESNANEAAKLLAGLEAIAGHPRCRLPRAEITIRLERYRAAITK